MGSGGHRTIYALARRLASTGATVDLHLADFGPDINDTASQLDNTGVCLRRGWETSTYFDYAMATVASSAKHVQKIAAANRGYLIQDFEAYFNPLSDGYVEAESSYLPEFDFLSVGSWLGSVMERRYGTQAFCAGLGADPTIYRLLTPLPPAGIESDRPQAVCFLYQPDKPRRTPELGIEALRLLKLARPEVEIYVYLSLIHI